MAKMLETYNQEHLLNIIEKMNNEQKKCIEEDLKNVDFEELNNLYIELKNRKATNDEFEPLEYIERKNVVGKYEDKGIEIIKNNKYAVITMAGGQGSRLGHDGPKGTFILNINGVKKSIFEVLSEKLIEAKKIYGVDIPWYIMTSCVNDKDTREFFKKNNNFGVKYVKFFMQNDIPVLSEEGKLLIGDDFLVKKAGNGNGGIYKALDKNGILEEMETKGIEWVFVSGVDNILAKLVDPLFVGLNYAMGTEIASKSTSKRTPNEKAGVFCKRNGRCGIVEYIETTKEMNEQKDENDRFVYSQMNILQHLYSLNALKKMKDIKLKYHIAHKKTTYLDNELTLVVPDEPNTYKFEQFVFDAFEMFDNMTVFNVEREAEFAPIKNATGAESPETAVELYLKENKVENK